jgi:DNA-binding helix-turn-helix protein
MTLRDLEEAAGVSKARLSMALNQDASPLNTNELEQICRALDVDPADICARAAATRKKELAAQILARAEAASQAGYTLAAHPADTVITEDPAGA